MTIDSGGGLGAEVAVAGVEIECTDAVFAADTLELYSPFDRIGGVVSHGLNCSPLLRRKDAPQWAVEGNLRSPLCEHDRSLSVTFACGGTSDNIICPPPREVF